MEPTPYGLVAFRANNMAPLRKVLLTAARPWIKVGFSCVSTNCEPAAWRVAELIARGCTLTTMQFERHQLWIPGASVLAVCAICIPRGARTTCALVHYAYWLPPLRHTV